MSHRARSVLCVSLLVLLVTACAERRLRTPRPSPDDAGTADASSLDLSTSDLGTPPDLGVTDLGAGMDLGRDMGASADLDASVDLGRDLGGSADLGDHWETRRVRSGGQRLGRVIGWGARRSGSVARADEGFGRPGRVSAGAAISAHRRCRS